jgi:GT2 family glycosyltransferase
MRPDAPWRILDLEIGAAPPALPDDTPIFAILRRNGAVVGVRRLLPCERPTSAEHWAQIVAATASQTLFAIAAIGDGELRHRAPPSFDAALVSGGLLSAVDAALAVRRSRSASVSAAIAICTRRRPDDLRDCLRACRAAAPGVEIIVIDNGPDPETRAIAEAAAVRYVAAPEPGLSRARNAALNAADTDVVIFVDDDVKPEPGFVDALTPRFDAEDVAVVCGLVLPAELETEAQIAFEHDLGFGGMRFAPLVMDSHYLRNCRDSAPVWEIGAGAVMAVRRRTAIHIGGFDERLGPGALGGCGDDSEFWRRALETGHRLRYEPLAVVRHRHRRGLDNLKAQARGYGMGHVAALYVSWARHRRRADLARIFYTLPRWYLRRVLKAPLEWAKGRPDRLLAASLRGWLSGVAAVSLLLRPDSGKTSR